MNKKRYFIKGTHCRSCELLIEDKMMKIPGVKKARVDYRTGKMDLFSDSLVSDGDVENEIRNAGYSLGMNKPKSFFSHNIVTYVELLFAGCFLLFAYFVLKSVGVLNLNFATSDSPSMLVVLLIGLTAGISTCMALVGGLVLGFAARHSELHPEATGFQKLKPNLFFNLGRLAFFLLLGGAIGLLGSTFKLSAIALGSITIIVGIVMLVLGLKLTELFPKLSGGGLMLPKGIARLVGADNGEKEYSNLSAFVSGGLTFFLPCGFTQAMQVFAISTGSFLAGGVIMFLFALGTTPGLLGIGSVASFAKGGFARYFFKFAGLVVIILAITNIGNGLRLTGFSFASSQTNNNPKPGQTLARVENGNQIVEITQYATKYEPNRVTVKKGLPVKLRITGTTPYSCSTTFVIPKYQIVKSLQQGVNEIIFTPTQTGPVNFSCAMGMYRGVINVVD
jgi:sulfite exporter TauE/SafE/copper chaperone CopZ